MKKIKKFKQLMAVILAVSMMFSGFTITSFAATEDEANSQVLGESYTSGDFEYTIRYDGAVEITKYTGNIAELEIPGELDCYTVAEIGNDAFKYCTSLVSVTIPDSVESIGSYAFYECENLARVTIGNGVTLIDYGAFNYCTSLSSITIPYNVISISSGAFFGCKGLTSINVDDNNQNYCNIDGVLFNKDATELVLYPSRKTDESYTIPDSVTEIGSKAFSGCENLATVIIPNGVTDIGYETFSDCSNLTGITIPKGVTEIGYGVFQYCTRLTSVTLPSIATYIGREAFYGCTSLTSIAIPDNADSIGDEAFYGCTSLASIAIPDNAEIIGNKAFYDCESLKSVTIGSGVASIGEQAFYHCTSLTSITVDENNECFCNINGVLFNKDATELVLYPSCKTDESYTIPDSVTLIDAGAFDGCTSLASVTIPESITSIGSSAFYGCTSLESIKIPDGVTSIGEDAFCNCSNLTTITIPDSVTEIGDSAFDSCSSLTSIKIPDNVTSIGGYVFFYCSSLENIIISDSLTEIGDRAFYSTAWYDNQPNGVVYAGKVAYNFKGDMPENTSIALKEGTKGIADSAFGWDYNITSITIPESVTSIGEYAFEGCTGFTSITIPDSVKKIGYSAFSGCENLTEVTVPGNFELGNFGNDDGWGYSCFDSSNLKNVIISESSERCNMYNIGNIFGNYVENIFIPDSVSDIILESQDYYSPFCFNNLKNIVVDENNAVYSSVDGVLFSKDKTQLLFYPIKKESNAYSIPNSVMMIGNFAFTGCENLANISVPDNLTYVGHRAFDRTAWLENQPDGVLYIGKTLYSYRGEMPEDTVIEVKSGTTQICSNAFTDCYQLKGIILNDGLKYIGDYAFYCSPTWDYCPNNEKLENILIPDSVTYIGKRAFYGCPSLKSVTLSENISEIGNMAFGWYDYFDKGCSFLGRTKNFTVYGYPGTAAEAYVNDENENNFAEFKFKALDEQKVVIGDVNGDGSVTVQDATVLQKYLAGLVTLSDEQLAVADTNGDGSVTVADATVIQKYLAGLVTSLG